MSALCCEKVGRIWLNRKIESVAMLTTIGKEKENTKGRRPQLLVLRKQQTLAKLISCRVPTLSKCNRAVELTPLGNSNQSQTSDLYLHVTREKKHSPDVHFPKKIMLILTRSPPPCENTPSTSKLISDSTTAFKPPPSPPAPTTRPHPLCPSRPLAPSLVCSTLVVFEGPPSSLTSAASVQHSLSPTLLAVTILAFKARE